MINYFEKMIWCMAFSVILLIMPSFLDFPPMITILSILPLGFYHFLLSKEAKNGLGQAGIDSVYYYGFLITIGALGISAFNVGMGGAKGNFTVVISQFGIGLIATVYAVIARMHLTSVAMHGASPEEQMEAIIRSYKVMMDTMEAATWELKSLGETILKQTDQTSQTIVREFGGAMHKTYETFEREMNASLDATKVGLNTIRQAIGSASRMIDECKNAMETAVKGMNGMAKEVADIGSPFQKMKQLTFDANSQLQILASAVANLDAATTNILKTASASSSLIANMKSLDSVLLPLAGSASSLTQELASTGKASGDLRVELQSLPKRSKELITIQNDITSALTLTCKAIDGTGSHLANFIDKANSASQTFADMRTILASAKELEQTIFNLERLFGSLSGSIQSTQKILYNSASNIANSVANSTSALEENLIRSSKAADLFTEKLAVVAQNVIDRTNE